MLTIHPEYPDAYLLRATIQLQLKTLSAYQKVVDDVNQALRYRQLELYQSITESDATAFSVRAKANKILGKYELATGDFELAVRCKWASSNDVLGVGGTKPDEGMPTDLWTLRDFHELISKYPKDARPRVFKGFFYSFFADFDSKYYAAAKSNYEKGISIDPKCAVAHFLLGRMYTQSPDLRQESWSDLATTPRPKYHQEVVESVTKAIQLDPNIERAYVYRAMSNFAMKKFRLAIADYERILEFDPTDAITLNDRGLAYSKLGEYWIAIGDFDRAIKLKAQSGDLLYTLYKNRVETQMKIGDFHAAVEDFRKAIQSKIGDVIILMNIDQIKSIYPELSNLADSSLERVLWIKLKPRLRFEDFVDILQENSNKPYHSTILPDLYVSRGDAYLGAHEFKNAIREYHRVFDGFPDYSEAVERWKVLSESESSTDYLDVRTVDESQDFVVFWTKEVLKRKEANGTVYRLHLWIIDNRGRRIKLESSTGYGYSGRSIGTSEGTDWQMIVPESYGEFLYNGWRKH